VSYGSSVRSYWILLFTEWPHTLSAMLSTAAEDVVPQSSLAPCG